MAVVTSSSASPTLSLIHICGGGDDGGGGGEHVAHVEHHSDRDEEEAGKDIAEGHHVAQGPMAVLGLGDDQSGKEGTQGERCLLYTSRCV